MLAYRGYRYYLDNIIIDLIEHSMRECAPVSRGVIPLSPPFIYFIGVVRFLPFGASGLGLHWPLIDLAVCLTLTS